ncbi:MAG: N-acetylmuramidase family protein [Bacteroidales bacterium]|nr:N-acetylmuramidase family protein [Bacteroidales bacterium]
MKTNIKTSTTNNTNARGKELRAKQTFENQTYGKRLCPGRMIALVSLLCTALVAGAGPVAVENDSIKAVETDSVKAVEAVSYEHIPDRLTDEDFREVAEELGVEVATIKAVVEIEAGAKHEGFWANGKPIINFDLSMFRKFAARNKINLSRYQRSHAVVFAKPNRARYGSYQAAQQARLDAARTIDDKTAIEGTFWGMFQLGGFNWKVCGTSSPDEFVRLMSRSERDQLELFAEFIRETGMLPLLKAKNWSAFARRFNGPSYARRGYHTRLARAYAKHKAKK